MLRKLLSTGQFRPFIIVGFMTLLLWLNPLLNPPPSVAFDAFPLQKWLWGSLLNHRLGAGIMALILTIILALMFYFTLRSKKFVPYRSTITLFLFIVIFSHNPNLCTIHPLSLPIICLSISLLYVLGFPSSESNFQKSFWAGFFTGLATLFYPPAVIFILFVWIVALYYSSSRGRDFLLALLGFLNPIILILGIMFLLNYSPLDYIFTSLAFFDIPNISFGISWLEWLFISVFTITTLYIFFTFMTNLLHKPIQFRRTSWIMTWFLVFSLLSATFSNTFFIYHLGLVSIPLSAFASAHFSEPMRSWRSEILLNLFFIIAFLQNLQIIH